MSCVTRFSWITPRIFMHSWIASSQNARSLTRNCAKPASWFPPGWKIIDGAAGNLPSPACPGLNGHFFETPAIEKIQDINENLKPDIAVRPYNQRDFPIERADRCA